MTVGQRFALAFAPAALVAVLATVCAAADTARSTLRLVGAEEPVEKSEPAPPVRYKAQSQNGSQLLFESDPIPTPSLAPSAELAQPEPPRVDLLDPAPNPYQATLPPQAAGPGDPHLAPPADWPAFGNGAFGAYLRNRPRQLPLQRESWLNRPFYLDFFVGGLWLQNPIHGVVQGEAGPAYGLRFGWDFATRWGMEGRIGGANPGVSDPAHIKDIPQAKLFFTDMDWLWYWTGDTRFRPFFLLGLGLQDLNFYTPDGTRFHDTTFSIPAGVGFKYRHSTRLAMRVDVTDNINFGVGRTDLMNNVSILAGLEARFGGGMRRNYWPWNPGHDWR